MAMSAFPEDICNVLSGVDLHMLAHLGLLTRTAAAAAAR
jgi:hypothetical protein